MLLGVFPAAFTDNAWKLSKAGKCIWFPPGPIATTISLGALNRKHTALLLGTSDFPSADDQNVIMLAVNFTLEQSQKYYQSL